MTLASLRIYLIVKGHVLRREYWQSDSMPSRWDAGMLGIDDRHRAGPGLSSQRDGGEVVGRSAPIEGLLTAIRRFSIFHGFTGL